LRGTESWSLLSGTGLNQAPCEQEAERDSFSEVVLEMELLAAMVRVSPAILDEARCGSVRPFSPYIPS